jgi:hypothetical protein
LAWLAVPQKEKDGMSQILPDCMMPDGAEPCKGYMDMKDEVKRLREALEAVDSETVLTGQLKELVDAALG